MKLRILFPILSLMILLIGCIKDTDGDGILDDFDLDNNTRPGVPVDNNGVMENPLYLDENGVTIKCYDWGVVGDQGSVNGIIYTVVSKEQLRNEILYKGDFSTVCTSMITDMSYLSDYYYTAFNQDISSWDVSNVTNMNGMFYGCRIINQDFSFWEVSNVTNMSEMFYGCYEFNQDLSTWDVSNVTDMSYMFGGCYEFNQNLSSWNVSNVTNMNGMFNFCHDFNQDLSSWDVSNVTNMRRMFYYCEVFNQDLSLWDVSNVTDMNGMFYSCYVFNQDLSNWDVSKVMLHSGFDTNCSRWKLPKPNFVY